MYNFSNLSDLDFEYLCKDMMSKRLGVEMSRFGPGRDGGVDLTDNVNTNHIVVQVKHYLKTSFNGLLRSLGDEIDKVKKLNPDDYYICVSKELTPENKKDIYNLFSNYMKTSDNVITLTDISDWLDKPENTEVLRRHYKLWISSTNVLDNLYNIAFYKADIRQKPARYHG